MNENGRRVFTMKRKMTYMVLGLTTLLMVGSTTAVSAYTKSNFSCTATKLMDGESTHIKKYAGATKGEATVSSMTNKGKSYEMWIEKGTTGTNVTLNYAFTNTCTKRLPYCRPAYQTDSYEAKLNISTSLNNFESCTFSGKWSPNLYAGD